MRTCLGALGLVLVLVFGCASPGAAGENAGGDFSHEEAAYRISRGHAYTKHVCYPGEAPDIRADRHIPHMSRDAFKALILDVLDNPEASKRLRGGRSAYWKTDLVVIVNPRARDRGTAFKPFRGKVYFDNLR